MKKMILFAVFLISGAFLFAQTNKKEKLVAKAGVTLPPDKQTPGQQNFGHQAVLTWTAPTTCTDGSPCSAVSYNVYKNNAACPVGAGLSAGTKIATVQAPTTTYTDTNITAPGSYCWYVTAMNANGESTASNAAGSSLTQPLLASPTNFSVTAQ